MQDKYLELCDLLNAEKVGTHLGMVKGCDMTLRARSSSLAQSPSQRGKGEARRSHFLPKGSKVSPTAAIVGHRHGDPALTNKH